jgi:hypothetical protein
MKKIMFNDQYGLTKAVLDGRKTMTRRLILQKDLKYALSQYREEYYNATLDALSDHECLVGYLISEKHSYYKNGEIVAVAQAYGEILNELPDRVKEHVIGYYAGSRAWTNKMFVAPWPMPHQIQITDIKVERLQDISDDDVYREGFSKNFINNGWGNAAFHEESVLVYYDKLGLTKTIRSIYPKEAFATLIDKVSGSGTWESNPWVLAYSFKLIK